MLLLPFERPLLLSLEFVADGNFVRGSLICKLSDLGFQLLPRLGPGRLHHLIEGAEVGRAQVFQHGFLDDRVLLDRLSGLR